MANSAQNKAIHASDGKRGTSDGHMVSASKTPPYPWSSHAEAKKNGKSFIARLEKHKEIGQSLDSGWKPRYKGQGFTEAIEEHKSHDAGEFR